MTLIDRDVLLEALETVDFCKCSTYGAEALFKDSVLEAIQEIDSIEVVRCRDCKFTDAHSPDMMHCKLFGLWMANNFFCADGTMALSSDKNKARK